MKIETEAGTQTRLFHFGSDAAGSEALKTAQSSAASWQGYSIAEWEQAAVGRGEPRNGDLKVVTTKLRPGYLRKNGIPYSENAIVTEWYDRHQRCRAVRLAGGQHRGERSAVSERAVYHQHAFQEAAG